MRLCDYGGRLEGLAAAGITYVPIVWSAYVRARPEAQAAFRTLALRAVLPLAAAALGRGGPQSGVGPHS
eukprot:4118974-Pyramimonas_sp.AAC.1